MTLLLLGRPDAPTDGVADYAGRLAAALTAVGRGAAVARARWDRDGWPRALDAVAAASRARPGAWVVVQYTALQWSRRGFPHRVPAVLARIRAAGARPAVVLHDPAPAPVRADVGPARGVADHARRALQRRVMMRLARDAEAVIRAVPAHAAGLDDPAPRARGAAREWVIPVGPNVDVPARPVPPTIPTLAVFGLTGPPWGDADLATLGRVADAAARAVGRVHVACFGRNTDGVADRLRGLAGHAGVSADAHGVVSAREAGRLLAAASVSVLVRGPATSGRGTLSAAIACGVPAVAWASPLTAAPLTAAGVVCVPAGDVAAFGGAVARILADPAHAEALRQRQATAWREAFSWEAIARRICEALPDA